MKKNNKENKEKELLNLIKKHIFCVKEDAKKDALNIVITCNSQIHILSLERIIQTKQSPIQPMFGPPKNFIHVPTEDTIDIDRFKSLWEELKNDN